MQLSNKKVPKTLAQQLRLQLMLFCSFFLAMILISFTFIVMSTIEFADRHMMKQSAHDLLSRVEKVPEEELRSSSYLKVYFNWDSIPLLHRQAFADIKLEPNVVYEQEYVDESKECVYLTLLLLASEQGKLVYFISEDKVDEADELLDTILIKFLSDTVWLIVFLFISLFFFIFWLLKKTNEPIRLLSEWADKLKNNDCLTQEEFPISEINDLAKQLKSGVEHITEYNQREQEFLRYASHEMRTPLATIQACLDTLNVQLSGATKNTAERALRACKNMEQLSNALLWLVRESNVRHTRSIINLPKLCASSIEDHKQLIANKSIKFVLLLGEELIEIEQDLFLIVFSNLLRNACQYSDSGTITIAVETDSLSISNPLETTTTSGPATYTGYGIGLQLVERICEKLSWRFTYQEKDGVVKAVVCWSDNQPKKN